MNQKEYKRQYYLKNKDKFLEYNKIRSKTEKAKSSAKLYYENNKDVITEKHHAYKLNRYKNDPIFKLKSLVHKAIYKSLNNKGIIKSKRTQTILGCSIEEFKLHLESQFEPWMNWENQGGQSIHTPNTNWDIDHNIPISSAQTEEDILSLNHYTNLKPICSYYNRFVKRGNIV